jgi:hypothetical protein
MKEVTGLVAERFKRRFLVGCLSLLVGIPVMGCCLLVLIIVILPALEQFSPGGNNSSLLPIILLIIGSLTLIVLIAFPVGIAAFKINKRARILDAVLNPLGFTGKAYLIYGRQYQGTFSGRNVDVYIYRGPTVEVRIKSTVNTRVIINPKDSISTQTAVVLGKPSFSTNDPSLDQFGIFPEDAVWAGKLLAEPIAIQTIKTLMSAGAEWAIIRRVEIQPGELLLFLFRSRKMSSGLFTQIEILAWLSALTQLAITAENLPAPDVLLEPTADSSRFSRQRMNKYLPYVIGLFVIGMPLFLIGIGVLTYLLVSLN